ncbi:uncharacterized protein LOC134793566 [Cydia splendana]|uniref:uncharacterized protein LOC134793566 n=1 Tax=Cydia splendana TaxID=1100963 RepID=UPI00300D3802
MEALERRGKVLAIAAILFIVFWSQCKGVEGYNTTKKVYTCPPQFIRLGHSCYFFSETKATWQNALFACKDRESNLTVPARWEDRNLRNYLNKPGIERVSRWIGGIYDYAARAWKWGGELRPMRYQSFSKMRKLKPEELQWNCIAMEPELLYRWAPESCYESRQYICKTKLKYHRQRNAISRERNDPRSNDVVTANPSLNPLKSYDLRPSALREMPKPRRNKRGPLRPSRKLTRPFPGYQWNRRDPEGSFQRNAELLTSGRTGLSPQQVNTHLARLKHLRDKQLRKKRIRDRDDWLVNEPKQNMAHTHARTYTVDNNISALHPKTIVEEFDMMPPPSPIEVRPARQINYD